MRCLLALLVLMPAANLPAQTTSPRSLAELVRSESSLLGAAPDLAAWRRLHPRERLKNAAYDNEYETQGLWCAASAADFELPGGIQATRQAFFYIPPANPGNPLPDRLDAGLLRQCRLLTLWYEVNNPANPAELIKAVSADLDVSLGSAHEERPPSRRTDGDWGSGYWSPYMVWDLSDRRVVLAVDPGGPMPNPLAHRRLLVIVRSSLAPRGLSFDWSGQAPKGQPALKDAAETTRVAHVENPCSFDDGHNNWERGLIRFGEKLLRDFPASRSKPYIHLTLARTYAATLMLTYPGVDLNGADRPAGPDGLRRSAVAHFRAFLEEDRDSPEAESARREGWRLLAGLPPSPIHFACTD